MKRADERWWRAEDEDEIARLQVARAHQISDDTEWRQRQIVRASCLYGDTSSWRGDTNVIRQLGEQPMSLNIIANAFDTWCSETTQTQPRGMATTSGGDWSDRQRARRLTAHWDAKFHAAGVHLLGPVAMLDAGLYGLGCIRPYAERGKLCFERLWPGNILVDDASCVDVLPRELHIRRFVDRYYLAELYPDAADAIDQSEGAEASWHSGSYGADVVEVIESWHLPSSEVEDGDEEHDGLHAIAINGALLEHEPWARQTFPLAIVRAVPPRRGWWGEAPLWRAAPYQREFNKMARRIQQWMHMAAVHCAFVQNQSGVVKEHLTNEQYRVIGYDGNVPPVFPPVPQMGAEVFNYQRGLKEGIFEVLGISQLSAQSVKPAGINAAVALETYNDVQTRRFVNSERAYEQMFVTLCLESLAIERQLAKDNPGYEVSYRWRRAVERTKFSEIDTPDDILAVSVYPASAFGTTPAMRLQRLEEALQQGKISYATFWEHVPTADWEAVRSRVASPAELIDERLSWMLEHDERRPPEPFMDLALARTETQLAIQRAEVDGVPPERIEHLIWFLGEVSAMQGAAAPPAPPAPPMAEPPMDPMMGGAMPPMGPPPNGMPMAIGNA